MIHSVTAEHPKTWHFNQGPLSENNYSTSTGAVDASARQQMVVDKSLTARARELVAMKIEFMASSSFEEIDADHKILGRHCREISRKQFSGAKSLPSAPPGTPPYLATLYEFPLLSREEEQHLFRKMNYLKYRADLLRKELDMTAPRRKLIDEIDQLLSDALTLRNQIVQANLRLVVSIAKTLVDRSNEFDTLVSDGNVPLIRAVEIFDFERGTRFSTYATWAIRNGLFRSTPRNRRQSSRFRTGTESDFEAVSDHRQSVRGQSSYHHEINQVTGQMLSHLGVRDRLIVETRFGLNGSGRPHRFREIAEKLGISTERVRQLFTRSLSRLQELLDIDECISI